MPITPFATASITGDTVRCTAYLQNNQDRRTANDTARLNGVITNSFDPNDKAVSHGTFTAPGQELRYRIRFQNTGTDTAFSVVVVDTLSDKLDLAGGCGGSG